MVFPVQQDGQVVKKTVYLVFGLDLAGRKEVLGIWIGEAESAKFWLKVLTDLKNRGVCDVLIASVDGLKGFKEAIATVFPQTDVQGCIVHQIRTSTRYVNYKDRKEFCADMCRCCGMQACKAIYTAPNEEAGLAALDRFEDALKGMSPRDKVGQQVRVCHQQKASAFCLSQDPMGLAHQELAQQLAQPGHFLQVP